MTIQTIPLSSLEKVFPDEAPHANPFRQASALLGERFSFQIACFMEGADKLEVAAAVATDPSLPAELYEVGVVPATFPVAQLHDEDYLRTAPGLFPDPLYPHEGAFSIPHHQWRSLWVSAVIPADLQANEVHFTVTLRDASNPKAELVKETFILHIIPAVLPEQKLIHTEWFYMDCLASYYKVPVFSEEHWNITEQYLKNAADFGVNMILTPVLTPPLDTQVGGERPTVQLVDITVGSDGTYHFGFDRLKRFIDLAERCGIRYFEISHLFTQWGAEHAPNIVAETPNGTEKTFGWETDASSPKYTGFLNAFLTALCGWLKAEGKLERCYFHISDEPDKNHLTSYQAARNSVEQVLSGCKIIDALSDYDFYEQGIVPLPIPSIDHIEPFLSHHVPNLWAYYCCAQGVDICNLFLSMPSYRNRMLGYPLYKYGIEVFLHWGYNFWYSQFSKKLIDPYAETGAVNAFPAGDAFLVYPGEDGKPVPSIHQFVQNEAFQDQRALELLEQHHAKEEIIRLLEQQETITFSRYPRSAEWILNIRETINHLIEQAVNS